MICKHNSIVLKEGHVAVITGASSGLGQELALQLSMRKLRIVITGRDQQRLNLTKKLCQSAGNSQIIAFKGDLSQQQTCKELIQFVVEKYSQINLLILNAGVNAHFKFDQLPNFDVFRKLMDTNFFSNVMLTKYALDTLKKSVGTILVISSLSGKFGLPDRTAYCASKFALTGFFQSLRTQDHKINIIMVYPTTLNTPMRQHALITAQNLKSQKSFDSKQCAQIIIEKLQKNTQDIYIPTYTYIGTILQPIFPNMMREKFKNAAKL